ncbi:MAG: uroporphyrinogen decarboxylase family protein [Spirochaetia bacterium]
MAVDFEEIRRTRDRLGDRGIVRSHPWSPGQGSPWQSFHALRVILERTLEVTEMWKGIPADMVETGGGAGSNALHAAGLKIVSHLCGGVMKMLDLVVKSGADGLETMTPPSMGGDCDLREASRRVGDRLFFMGGFDQNAGFERGSPEAARRLVMECFEATRDHAGYICVPSDHFFFGDPANIQAFADACRECRY